MQVGRCPNCHHRLSLEQICQDEAGHELTKLLFQYDAPTRTALTAYLGLFRSTSRDLSNDRALKLLNEVLVLEAPQWLLPALQDTVESIRTKRETGQVKPLSNHNYLKRVLESTVANGVGKIEQRAMRTADSNYLSSAASFDRLNDTTW
ncbi:hypothetical protein [Oceanobacter sp. 4_MG-2023]|uniref:hypothetical protein n=1 Tax=Oceanobacter sp. 4_MG-2023 TaxID=3062623 RepID=UPI00273421E9|nr:hypothetical protein [Oceanobacter sp. 4_MG-2023]MDP2548063.1 hypothetical protein [Oceanobacter sp. 4_MG-2023]